MKFKELQIGTMFTLQGKQEYLVKITDTAIITGLNEPFNSVGTGRFALIIDHQLINVVDLETAESRNIDSQIEELAQKLHILASVDTYEWQ